jgi:hypothetical protein
MTGSDIEQRQPGTLVHVPGMPQPKRESEALPAKWARAARRRRDITVPAALPIGVWTAADVMHAYGLGPEAAAASVVGGIAVWLFAPHKWTDKKGEPRAPEVWYARLTAVAFPWWATAAAFLGPVSGDGAPLAGSLAVLSGTWGYFWWKHHRVRGMRDREKFLRRWQAWWNGHSYAWGVGGSNVIEAEEKGTQVRLRIQLIPGKQSHHSVKSAVHLIESALQDFAGLGMVRVAVLDGNPSQVDVFFKRVNPLREVVEWDPALAPASVHGQAVAGKSETGEWATTPMRASAFVNGKTRTGKGNHLLLRVAQLSGCPDDRQVVIDLKQRAARTLLRSGGLEYVITTVSEARAYLLMLQAERAARAREADTDEEQLLATEATPALHTLIDETNPLTSEMAGDAECARLLALLAAEGAGLEEYVEVYTQYGALAESVQTEQTRMNLPLRVCYAVERPEHGEFALGSGGGDASKLEEKGEFLMKLGPRARQERLRAPHMPFRLFLEIVSENAARLRRRPLHLYCGNEPSVVRGLTWQEWWDRRFLRIDPAFRKDSPQYAAAVEEFGEPQDVPAPDSAAGAEFPQPRPAAAPPERGGESGAAVAARIAAETAGEDIAPVPGAASRASEIWAKNQDRFFGLLADAPPEGVRTAWLVEESDVSNGWAYKTLNQLTERGAVTQPKRGMFAPVPGRDVKAEAAALKAGTEALGRDAASRVERHLQSVS